ncbi:MAG TPA: hypothetical protein VEI01_11195 [Terriglobales bacterium]|nr:hypothetical protein [Terriglobales bacterium]
MKVNLLLIATLVLVVAGPPVAQAREKKHAPRGMIESMQSMPCGVEQRGLAGLGSIFASVGATAVNSNEKLCPQYLLRTDELEYHIRPLDGKHPVLLPIGHEAEFKIKKDCLFLKVPDGDKNGKKMRAYQVIAMEPVSSTSAREGGAYRPADRSTEPSHADRQAERVINQNDPPPQ